MLDILTNMGRKQLMRNSIALFSAAVLISSLNVFALTRDVPMTVGVEKYELGVEEIMFTPSRFWVESPVQTLQTFLGSAVFENVGNSETGEFDFVDRLVLAYGENSISREPIIDVREGFSPEELAEFREQLVVFGYSSERACPHDVNQLCEIYVAWNGDRTRERGIRMLSLRVSENEYAIVDDSVISVVR